MKDKKRKEKPVSVMAEYYEARRKAMIELGKARRRLHPPKKDAKENRRCAGLNR